MPAYRYSRLALILSCLLFLGFARGARSQAVIPSSDGYQVHIDIHGLELVPLTVPCTWGYTYQVRVYYTVTFTGSHPPANMYTLQGTVGCGGSTSFFDLPNGPASGSVLSATAWRGVADCATATAHSIGCNTVMVQIEGPGISDRTITVDGSTLPITLVSFLAEPAGTGILLEWSTASEKDNAHFTVERSADAITFGPVLQLPGAGNSQALLHYSAMDPDPMPGTSYYRLRQTDFNGTTTVSDMVAVIAGEERVFTVQPNPASSSSVRLPSARPGRELEVRTMQGHLVAHMPITGTDLLLPQLPSGAYMLVELDPRTGRTRHCRWVRE